MTLNDYLYRYFSKELTIYENEINLTGEGYFNVSLLTSCGDIEFIHLSSTVMPQFTFEIYEKATHQLKDMVFIANSEPLPYLICHPKFFYKNMDKQNLLYCKVYPVVGTGQLYYKFKIFHPTI
jgi:hypothetical protein